MKKSIWIPLVVVGGAGLAASIATSIYFATRKTSYTIKLDLDGGKIDGVKDSIKVAKGSTIGSLPTPKKENYDFAGWIETNLNETINPETEITANMSLKATYTSTSDIVISGEDEIFSKTASSVYTVSTSFPDLDWKIDKWTGKEQEKPVFVGDETYTRAIKTFAAGEFDIVVSGAKSIVSKSMHVTIIDPTVKSNKIWVDYQGAWYYINTWDTNNIHMNPLEGSDKKDISVSDFNAELFFGEHVEVVGNAFLKGCTKFNSQIHFDDDLQVIGDEFLKGCTKFNNGSDGTSNIPMTLKCGYIGSDFLYDCQAFDNSVTVNETVNDIGENFMFNCINMTNREDNPSQIFINTSFVNFAADAEIPLTFAAIEKEGTAWATNGLPVVFKSQEEQSKFCDIFKNMGPTPQDPEAFFRNINGSHQ
ncbi:MAG: InlB B-repeat-containing protein [Mycoplasma sp.]|nr:InlB B-repeat-containing protein [Candidatus Hennigella equi]